MTRHLRSLARRLGGVTRPPTYYLPWITRPGLECALVLSNVEARFKPEYSSGPFPVRVVQYDAHGRAAHRYDVTLKDSTDTVEVPLEAAGGGCGFATVSGDRLCSGCRPWAPICSTPSLSAPRPRRAPPSGGSGSKATPGSTSTWSAPGRG